MNTFHFYRYGSTTAAAITFTSAATACRVSSLRATRGPSPPCFADHTTRAARHAAPRLTRSVQLPVRCVSAYVKCSIFARRTAPLPMRTGRSGMAAVGYMCMCRVFSSFFCEARTRGIYCATDLNVFNRDTSAFTSDVNKNCPCGGGGGGRPAPASCSSFATPALRAWRRCAAAARSW
jgi:hypothetical protein